MKVSQNPRVLGLKKTLKQHNISIPKYEDLRGYCISIDVGHIDNIHLDASSYFCMGYKSDMVDTLQLFFSTEELYKEFKFQSIERKMIF